MAIRFSAPIFSGVSRVTINNVKRQLAAAQSIRALSTNPEVKPEEHKAKALSIIDALPGNSIVSKTGFVTVSTTLTAWLISKEIYVVNEETLVAASFFTFIFFLLKNAKEPYNQWAQGRIDFIKGLLNDARAQHKKQVQARIEDATQMADIVPITKSLFEMSTEMASMQSKIFELKQQVQVNAEIKSTLDSWVRYETSLREREQKQLASQVMANIEKSLKDPKLQAQLLKEAVAEVQKLAGKK